MTTRQTQPEAIPATPLLKATLACRGWTGVGATPLGGLMMIREDQPLIASRQRFRFPAVERCRAAVRTSPVLDASTRTGATCEEMSLDDRHTPGTFSLRETQSWVANPSRLHAADHIRQHRLISRRGTDRFFF